MGLGEWVRRWAAPAAGLAGAAALCVACSSSTGGSPATSNPGGVSIGSQPAPSVSITGIPSITGLPSISGLPSIGGDQANSAFCKDINGQNLTDITASSDLSKAAAELDKLAADAPDAIKSDVDKIRDFVHGVMNGSVNPSDAQAISQAAVNVGKYAAEHCAG